MRFPPSRWLPALLLASWEITVSAASDAGMGNFKWTMHFFGIKHYTDGVNTAKGKRGLDEPWETNPLLPKDVVPLHYDIYLDPNVESGNFLGRVNITLSVTSPKDHIILHTKQLNITSSQLFTEKQDPVPVKSAFEYAPNEYWVVVLGELINPGQYVLNLDFDGSMVGSLVGLYRSSYKKKDGTLSHIATTKFEPTYARRAFPCFDEPAFKATFSTRLVRPAAEGYIALSNMNQISEEQDTPEKGKVTVHFAKTPRMSTYLACFIVCDFPHLPSVTVKTSGTKLTVYARDGQLENAKHPLNIALQVLEYFNEYFGMKYPLPKLDLIAVPDFVSGAMENWGLVTFRETRMLAGPDAAVSSLSSTANVVSHELAHMWFGDIVTMGWWDDLWLNEGFATFLANAVQTKLMPNFPVQDEFVLDDVHAVLVDDMAVSSHPIIRPVSNPDQITEAFDIISYQKGSSVLRMVEHFDPEGFRKAVVRYLDKHKYSNANTSDLWAQLSVEYTKSKDVTRMLDTWTKQMGYPLVQVERKGNKIELRQIRCLNNVNVKYDPSSSKFGYKWDIPVMYITSANKTNPLSLVMKMEEEVVTETIPDGAKWFKLNYDQYGFYRVNYTEQEWENLKNVLTENPNEMSSIDRANLIDDAFALAKAGYVNYQVPLNLITYLENGLDKDYAPWHTALVYYSQLKNLLYVSEDASKDLKTYFTKLVTPSLNDHLWDIKTSDPPKERYYKATLVSLACKLEIETCVKKANQLFNQFLKDGTQPPIDLKDAVFIHGIKGPALKSNWNKMWEMYLAETDPQQKAVIQGTLTSVTDPELIHKLLDYAKNESFIRSQDYFTVVFSLSRYPEAVPVMWDWVRENWDYLVNRFTLNHRQFGNVLPVLARNFYTEQRLKELEDFMAKHPEQGAGAAGRLKAVERTKANILLNKEYQPIIKDLLKKLVLIEYAKNESLIREQDYFGVLFQLTGEIEGVDVVWNWVRNNWGYLVDRFTLNDRNFGKALPIFAEQFYSQEKLAELEDLLAKYPEGGAGANGRVKAVETAKQNIIAFNKHQPVLKELLKKLVT